MLPIPDSIQMRLVLVLVHFLWQATLIAALLAGSISLLRIRSPRVRYAHSLLSLMLMAACPVATWIWMPMDAVDANRQSTSHATPRAYGDMNAALTRGALSTQLNDNLADSPQTSLELNRLELDEGRLAPSEMSLMGRDRAGDGNALNAGNADASQYPGFSRDALSSGLSESEPAWWQPAAPWIVSVWLIGVVLLSLRLLLGAWGTWRWRQQLEPLPKSLAVLVDQLCGLLGMRVPRVAISSRVTEAVAIGLLRPLVLLPAAWVTSIPPDMLEGILAHELAHIRRYDLWVNLFQRVIETLFFYHPAVWWLSNRLRSEREFCCDDLAVSVTQDDVRYAEMLEHVGRMKCDGRPSPIAVSISPPRHALLERVRHVLRLGAPDDTRGSSLAAALLLTMAVLTGAQLTSKTMLSAGEWSWKKMHQSYLGEDRHHALFLHNGKRPAFVVVRHDPPGTESSSNGLLSTGTKRGGEFVHHNFTISFKATRDDQPLETLTINGQAFNLREGRVLVMGDQFRVTQLPIHEPDMVTKENLKQFVQDAVAQAEKLTKADKPQEAVIASEPKPAQTNIGPVQNAEAGTTYRGRIVTEDGSPLPAGLKLMRRVSSEETRETAVDAKGEFAFQTDPQNGSVRFSIKVEGFAPFDSEWMKLDKPLILTLSRGAAVTLRMKVPDGAAPLSGKVRLIVRWYDDDEQGEFPVDPQGVVTIAHCPKRTVDFDVRVPGYEELRIHRPVQDNLTLDVPLTPAKPTRMRIVSARNGRPIAGARLQLFTRTRAGSFLTPYRYYGNDEIWGVSNADGLVTLTTLRAIDPVPTNDPGAAIYAFRIDAPGHAPRYIGDVRAGADLGDIALSEGLEVRGEVIHETSERVSLQVRQPTVAQGGASGLGDWLTMPTVKANGKTTFHLTNLQPGPFDLFIVYSDANQPPNSPRGNSKQLPFRGTLTASSSNLKITRESVTPGDGNLISLGASLFTIDSDRSNVSSEIVRLFIGDSVTIQGANGKAVVQETKPTLPLLFAWSNTAPMQHSMGHVSWSIFVLQDGTVFIPGGMNRDAGLHYKLSTTELAEFKSLLEKHRDLFGRQVPKELPQFAGWRHGHQTMYYTNKEGVTKAFTDWTGVEDVPVAGEFDSTGSPRAISDYLGQLMSDAHCGGREAKSRYRDLANKALSAALPQATPFNDSEWTNTANETDGTRTIRFANTDENTEVTLIHPAFGDVYVERIKQFDKRIEIVPFVVREPRDAELSQTADLPRQGSTLPKPNDKQEDLRSEPPQRPETLAQVTTNNEQKSETKASQEQSAIDRAVQFLKSKQLADGTWPDAGSKNGGTMALATVALMQAGVKSDDAVIQRALAEVRKIEPKMIYVIALQTMALCAAARDEDADLIRRNVTWIENAQMKSGLSTGGWSYVEVPAGRADGSCSRFAILGLDAAKRAKFKVKDETWQRAATYWLKNQTQAGTWGYVEGAPPTYSMTLAGLAGLAIVHRYLPKDDQAAIREAAIRKSFDYIEKLIPAVPSSWPFYCYHALERAGNLTNTARFGDVDWKSVTAKRLMNSQRADGAWVGQNNTEDELIATSFALMFLSGQPDAPVDGKANGDAKPEKESQKSGAIESRPLSIRGRVMIDGPIPDVQSLKIKPTLRLIIPRTDEDQKRNEERAEEAPVVEIPDDTLVISKEGGLANVVLYLKKAPKDWKPTPPPTDPVEIEAVNHRFTPHIVFIRTGQSLKLKNSMNESFNFRNQPLNATPQNLLFIIDAERLIQSPYTKSEPLPNQYTSDIQPWMKGYLLALDHPFAAITDAEGRFEIRSLPPGEHHFTVWHERRGYLNRDLVIRIEEDKVSEVDLKYTAEQLERRAEARVKAQQTGLALLPEHSNPDVVKLLKQFQDHFSQQRFAEAELAAKQAIELDSANETLERLRKIAIYARRLASEKDHPQRGSLITIAFIDQLMKRQERVSANDREATAKLVGRWMLTVSERHVYPAEITQGNDGLLLLTGVPKNVVLWGRYAVTGDRLELVEPNDPLKDDFVWQIRSSNNLSLVVSKSNNNSDYTGARLERLAEAPRRIDEKKDQPNPAQSDSAYRIPAHAVEQAKRLAAEARSKRTSLKQRRPAGLEELDNAEAIRHAAERAMKELADEKTNESALSRLEYLGDDAFDVIVAGTKSENPLVARLSCRALQHRGKKAVKPLCDVVDSHVDLSVREMAISTLGQTFEADAVPTLIRALDVKELQVGAMTALQYIRDRRAIEPLKKLVPIGGIGHAAEQAIKHIESPQGYAWCPPESRDLWQLCHDAQTLKGESYGSIELKRLVEGVSSDNPWIGYWCLSALSSLDSAEAVPAIITAPLSESKFQFLAGIATPAAVEHIFERLHSLNPQTRELAIQGLANGGGRWAAPILVTLLDDPNLTVPEKKNTNDPLGLNARVDPLNNWPESHRAHSALFMFFSRFGMNGQFRNLYLGESNDVRMEITQLKAWWKEHGEDFLAGRNVPNPNLTSVWYNDP